MNYFAISVVALFLLACAIELAHNNIAKAVFYALSASINACVLFLR